MIRLEVQPYCNNCLEFSPDVEKPSVCEGWTSDGRTERYIYGDTIIRCANKHKCDLIKKHLESLA